MNPFLDEDVPDVTGHLFGRERVALVGYANPSRTRLVLAASTATRRSNATIPSTTYCPGRCSGLRVSPTSSRLAVAATATSATHYPRHRLSTGCLVGTETCWKTSPQLSSGPPSTTARSQPPVAPTSANPKEARHGPACGQPIDLTWALHTVAQPLAGLMVPARKEPQIRD